ncbi:MAG: ABC transporter substrate-binding protein [Coriobacteriia bacterium]|nr:ABC transporter substrate-binding protein [Coriobacteriia bacterium]
MENLSKSFSRRQFLKYLTAATASVGAFALVGCQSNDTTGTDGTGGTGSTGSSQYADTLTYAQGADPRALDPAFFDDGESAKVACNIYEGLYRYDDKTTDVLPSLATALPDISEDGLTYKINLRQGVKFQDGTDFTADAVRVSWERQLSPNATSDMPYASFVFGSPDIGSGLDSINIVDDYNIELTLRAPSSAFLRNLAMTLAAPICSPTALNNNAGNISEAPVGTGPYSFVSWTKSDNIKLLAYADYWDTANAPKTKNVIFKVIPENATRVTALLNNEVDVIDGVDVSAADQIINSGFTLFAEDGMTINYMAFNTSAGVCTDQDVRRALAQAVNVEELVTALYGDYASPATTVMPLWMAPYASGVTPVSFDPDTAKATLAAKGVTSLTCITYTNPRPYNTKGGQVLAESIQGYLQNIGVTMTITPYDWTTYKTKVQTDPFDIAFYGWTGDNGDPDNFMNLLADPNPSMNISRFNDPDYNALIVKGLETPDGPDRDAVYLQCEEMVAEKAPWLCISHAKNLCGVNPKVNDFYYHPTGSVFLRGVTKNA